MRRGASVVLGYEMGTGESVSVPLRHMVITGQTQEAGKTTALEALVARSGVKAIAFVTKRGEGSFADARAIPPYFREQADWQFVASILEASRGEKLKFERAWIIRAAKGAHTLAGVQANVVALMGKASGLSADVYLVLNEYLKAVVPQIEAVQWAKRVELSPGLNVMDLTGINVEMQHLVIRSTIDWVLHHESNTVVVVPEAWKFVPQGRGTPVKLAAEAFIRQAAGLGNYLWLDSQDIAGVEKIILKSVPVWILGVQRESNEIKRTLAQIPAGIASPKPAQIATLGLGQFFACHGTTVQHVYVQPAWMESGDAREVAMSRKPLSFIVAKYETKATPQSEARADRVPEEPTVTEKEAAELRRENAELRRKLERLEAQLRQPPTPAQSDTLGSSSHHAYDAPGEHLVGTPRSSSNGSGAATSDDDALADRVIQRILARDPAPLIQLVKTRPEIEVHWERKSVTLDGTTVKGRVARLLAEDFFASGKRPGEVRSELQRTGRDVNSNTLQTVLVELVVDGFLTNEGSGRYKSVPEALVRVVER